MTERAVQPVHGIGSGPHPRLTESARGTHHQRLVVIPASLIGHVAIDDAAAERLVHAFQASGFQIDAVLVNKRDRSLATVRVHEPETKVLVDLLISFCGIEREVVEGASLERWRDLTLPVVTRGHLIAVKLLANRKQDQADLEGLLRGLPASDKRQALVAVGRMMADQRGDGRDLSRELKELLAESGAPMPSRFEPRRPNRRR